MAVTVRIPAALRKFANGQESVEAAGATVGEVIADVMGRHPDLGRRICDDAGEIRRFVNVFRGDEDIRFLDRLGTAVADGDELSIIPAIAGGSR